MKSTLDEFASLWEGDRSNYVLVKGSQDRLSAYLIFNLSTRMATVIDDDSLGEEVVKRMMAAGVPVVERLPASK